MFGMKTESNGIELFVKFKRTKLNRTICILNWIELFKTKLNCSKPNRVVIIGTVERKKYK